MTDTLLKGVSHVDPTELTYTEYFDHLLAFNRGVQRKVSGDLERILSRLPDLFVACTTGSDGRLEKGPVSPIEIMLFVERGDDGSVEDIIETYASGEGNLALFKDGMDKRDLESGDRLAITRFKTEEGEVEVYSPHRILDANQLFGSEHIYRRAQRILAAEVGLSEEKTRYQNLRRRTRAICKISESGEQKYKGDIITHYDLDRGVAHYDPENSLLSFKQGPLRAVQYALVRDTIKSLRAGASIEDLMRYSKNTVEKINELGVEGLTTISSDAVADLTDSYKFFLHQYHRSQQSYRQKGEKAVSFSVDEAQERAVCVARLCAEEIFFMEG